MTDYIYLVGTISHDGDEAHFAYSSKADADAVAEKLGLYAFDPIAIDEPSPMAIPDECVPYMVYYWTDNPRGPYIAGRSLDIPVAHPKWDAPRSQYDSRPTILVWARDEEDAKRVAAEIPK